MKSIKFLFALIAFVMSFSNCSDDPSTIPIPDPDEIKAEPTPVGVPIGVPNSKVIGASGGTIVSLDGMMGLEIPAGALSADTEINIQPITNFAPNGNGNAYQLSPEGIKFSKPIKITFRHGHDVSSTMPALTGIAFQDADGIWNSSGKFSWDSANKTVSTETTHFSGWATFDVLKIYGSAKAVVDQYGNTLYQMKVTETQEFSITMINSDALTGNDDELIQLRRDNNDYKAVTKEWHLYQDPKKPIVDLGKITPLERGTESVCEYEAPSKEPKGSNPVSLSVTLTELLYKDPATGKDFNNLQLSTQIEITGEFHFKLEIKYNNPLVGPFGGLGDFVNTDLATLKIHVKANGEVIVSDPVNAVGTITPGSFTRLNCTATWIPQEDSDPGITVTGGTGAIISGGAGNSLVDYLFITLKGDTQMAKWKVKCEDGDPDFSGGESSSGQPLIGPAFPLNDDSEQTFLDASKVWSAKLTPE